MPAEILMVAGMNFVKLMLKLEEWRNSSVISFAKTFTLASSSYVFVFLNTDIIKSSATFSMSTVPSGNSSTMSTM